MRKLLSYLIYRWADKRYGVKARGPVKGFKVWHDPKLGVMGISDFTPEQKKKLKKWHFWMNIKNKL